MAVYRLSDLAAGYAADWSRMTITKTATISAAARKIVSNRRRYETVGAALGIPWAVVGLLHMREADCDFGCHLHNGDSLKHRTIHVPAGRLTTHEPPFSWEESAIDALRLDGLDKMGPWTLAAIAFAAEKFNGFGPRNRGRKSGYLWAGSSIYDGGKYVADNRWDGDVWDTQPGVMAVLRTICDMLPGEQIIPGVSLTPRSPTVADAANAHPIVKAAAKVATAAAPAVPTAEAASSGSVSVVSMVAAGILIAALVGLVVWLVRRRNRLSAVVATPIEARPQFETRAAAEAAPTEGTTA